MGPAEGSSDASSGTERPNARSPSAGRAEPVETLSYDMKYKDRSIAFTADMEGFARTELQLLTGRVAMVLSMSYMIPELNRVKDEGIQWGIAHIPRGPHGHRHPAHGQDQVNEVQPAIEHDGVHGILLVGGNGP